MKYMPFIGAYLFCITVSFAQQKAVSFSLQPLRANVYMLDGGLGNVTLLFSPGEVLVVDTKSKEAGDSMVSYFTNKLHNKKIRYIVNTHSHHDHTGNNERLGKGATIISQQNSRKPVARNTAERDSIIAHGSQ